MATDESFLPLCAMPSSDDELKHSSPVPVKAPIFQPGAPNNLPPHNNTKTTAMHGQLRAPEPGRLTPTGPGRMKAPPVCVAPSLKRDASDIDKFHARGVCFSLKEASACANKALLLTGQGSGSGNVEEMPLNIQNCDAKSTANQSSDSEGNKTLLSSSSTVVTASSCGRTITGNGVAVGPPLAVVQTDLTFNSEDEHPVGGAVQRLPDALAAVPDAPPPPVVAPASSSASLSTKFTDNLAQETSSRQGRTLQRWLVHPPTKELVRQVAGTIPITRDGRVVLVSASRKAEWILPKGGWDNNESREECAARETFEEGGILGSLGGCLPPIDYETAKARKRRLSKTGGGGGGGGGGERKRSGAAHRDPEPPPPSKRVKLEKQLTDSESSCNEKASGADIARATSASAPKTPFDPKHYSYVRLFLFPLYVSSVKSNWPEKGRLRKMVDIDEAIEIMEAENRSYFKKGLEMLKERGLHLLKP